MPPKGQNMEANLLCTNRCIKWSLGDPIPSQSKKTVGAGTGFVLGLEDPGFELNSI